MAVNTKGFGRALIEALFIVASILLAFWIDAWWQGRGELELEDEVRDAFIDELRENQSYAREVIAAHDGSLLRIDRFVQASPDDLVHLPFDSVRSWVSAMQGVRVHQPLASASSMLLQTPPSSSDGVALRTLVGRYVQRTASVEDGYASLDPWRLVMWERLAPHAAPSSGEGGAGIPEMVARRGPDALVRLRADPELVAALVAKSEAQRLYRNLLLRLVAMGDSVQSAVEDLSGRPVGR